MTTRNDITGDLLKTKGATGAYRDGWERIFGQKTAVEEPAPPPPAPPSLPTALEHLPGNLDETVLAGRPSSLEDRANWWAWCEKHQRATSTMPTFEQWRDAHLRG